MKDTELLVYKIERQKIEISSLERRIDRLVESLGKLETVVRDLLIHMELEFYTERIDGWVSGHGVREVSDKIKEMRE